MNKTTLILTTFFLMGCLMPINQIQGQNSNQKLLVSKSINKRPTTNNNDSKLRHVVLLSFKDETSTEDIRKVQEAFSALPGKIPQIKDYEWGTNNSPEGLNDGLTHCFLVTFDSEEDRATYLPHPGHQAFVKILQPYLDRAVAVSYTH